MRVEPKRTPKVKLQAQKHHSADLPDPPPSIPFTDGFDEDAYLGANPDVAAAVTSAEFRSGYLHYLAIGWREKRLCSSSAANLAAGSYARCPG
jgi:hypothetical protein